MYLLRACSSGAIGVSPGRLAVNAIVTCALVVVAAGAVPIASVRAIRDSHSQHDSQKHCDA